jgi:glycosyltransferase involved in cell wall biosynthesis
MTQLDFSIITPSLDCLPYLKRCCAAVRDQSGASLEHIIVDGGSSDGTRQWLESRNDLLWISEKDNGMYDAINKGLNMAGGSFVAYLNCDEQYLPSTLKAVNECFQQNPSADVVFGDMLVVRPDGSLLACRKAYPLRRQYISASHLYVPSCCIFWRRRIVEQGYRFPTEYKTRADAEYVVNLLQNGFRTRHLKRYLAAFTITDRNLGSSPIAAEENRLALSRAPIAIRMFRHVLTLMRRIEKLCSGAYFQKFPVVYEIYGQDDQSHRTTFTAKKASVRWPG